MRIPGRQWTGNLVLLPPAPPETEIDYIAPATPFIAVLPKNKGAYPLKEFNQLNLNFGLWEMPEDATYVDVTLIKFRGFLIPPGNPSRDVGTISTGTVRYEFFLDQFLEVDGITNKLDPEAFTIRHTAAAPTLAYNGQTYSMGNSYNFPLKDDFVGFLVQSDATEDDRPGLYTMSITLGCA